MSNRRKGLRRKKSTRRIDPSAMVKAIKDRLGDSPIKVGIVEDPDGEGHAKAELDLITGEVIDILVEVVLQPDLVHVTARLSAGSRGVWGYPSVGDEVLVLLPEGDVSFMPVIVGVLSTGKIPDGLQENRVVVVGNTVIVHSGSGAGAGAAKALATKEDVDNVVSFLEKQFDDGVGHTHSSIGAPPTPGTGTGTGTGFPGISVAGTQILKSE